MDEISKLKIELYDLSQEKKRILFRLGEIKELDRAKSEQLANLEGATPANSKAK